MKHKLLFACISLGLILSANHRLAAQNVTPPSLAGSWTLTLVPVSPAANPAVMPIEGLVTFTSDGSLVETDSTEVSPALAPAAVVAARAASYGTPGHGIWQAGPAFGSFYIQFMSLFVNPGGILQARKVVTITAGLDSTANHLSGNYTYQLIDPAGKVAGTGGGTVTGTRMVHPLLPGVEGISEAKPLAPAGF